MIRSWLPLVLGLLPVPATAAPPAELCLSDALGLKVSEARLFDGIGPYRATKISIDAEAQRYFEQGMVFGWGFNFAEAARSFRAAVVRDPACSLCRWGIAWAVGPSINADMAPAELPVARDAIMQAQVYASEPRSRELVAALATRFPDKRGKVGEAEAHRYSEAMESLSRRRPNDADIAVLAAEALMVEHSYDWWRSDGTPQPWTPRIVALLDRALQLAPEHPGAHHYRIHLYGESPTPAVAVDSAQQLAVLAPGVGHLVHMPAHVYMRVGRYHAAVLANLAAVDTDRRYAEQTQPDPQYVAGYVVHNQHFLWAAALWSGESALALSTAQTISAAAAASERVDPGTQQHLIGLPWLTDVRFARWDAIVERPVPRDSPYLEGLAAFARGTAFARTGHVARAEAESKVLSAARRATAAAQLRIKNIHRAGDVLGLAEELLRAEIAGARGNWVAAARYARAAEKREQALESDEPPVWPLPALQALGRAQLKANAPGAALGAYQRDLERYPANAYSLLGSAEALQRLADNAGAATARDQARTAWAHADVPMPFP